jgi:hypothetical protein
MSARVLWVLPLAFLLASCGPPVSVHPLEDPKTAPLDKALNGVWYRSYREGEKKDSPRGLRFAPREEGGWLLVPMKDEAGWNEKEACTVFTTIVGCDRYLNMRVPQKKGKKEIRYVFCKYSLSLDGSFMLALMAEKPVARAIEEERLQGKVERNQKGELKSVLIPDSSDKIRAYIEEEDPEKLFRVIGTFKRTGKVKAEEQF